MTGGPGSAQLTRVTGAAILDRAGSPSRLLVAQRAYPESLRGLWEFPGGKQDPGENAEQALVRECAEELGATVELLDEVPAPNPDGWPLTGTAVMRVFTAIIPDACEPVAGEDHLELHWVDLNDPAAVLDLAWIPADLPIVRALIEQLGVVAASTPGLENPGSGAGLSDPLKTGPADIHIPDSSASRNGR